MSKENQLERVWDHSEELEKNWEIKRFPSSAITWDNIHNCGPIEDLRSWQKSLGEICGVFGNQIEFNYKTFSYIQRSQEYKRLEYKPIVVPSDLQNLLWSDANILINDSLKDGKIIVKSCEGISVPWYKFIEATVL